MRRMLLSTMVLLAGLTLCSATAVAEESGPPHTPHAYSTTELIDFGTYDKTPLKLPWTVDRIDDVPRYSRVDFDHIIEASFGEVEQHMLDAYNEQKTALRLKAWATPRGASPELRVLGAGNQQDDRVFTLGNGALQRRLHLRLTERDGETVLVFKNGAFTRTFDAGVPGRAPLKPVDAESIDF